MIKNSKFRRNEAAVLVVSNNVRKYRILKGITIMELADMINTDYSQISRIERGVINPSISMVFDIADALTINPTQLLEEFQH